MTTSAFTFLTLDTGHSVLSSRSEVEDQIVREIQNRLTPHGRGAIGGGWAVRNLRREQTCFRWEMVLQSKAVSWCLLCFANGEVEWKAIEILMDQGVIQKGLTQPPIPWLAVKLTSDYFGLATRQPDRAMELGDAERCVAWALLESRQS